MTKGVTPENGSLMAEIFQFAGAGFGRAAHAFVTIDPRNGALIEVIVEAVRVTVLDS
jgi:hypothetical protein